MTSYIFRRAITAIVLFYFSVTIIFFIVHAAPGNPYARMLNEFLELNPRRTFSETHFNRLNTLIGIDQPLPVQYVRWLRSVSVGDFGASWSVASGMDVRSVVLDRLPYTMLLMLSTTIIALVIAIPLGIYSAIHQYSNGDLAITTLSYFGIAMPAFWIGLLLIAVFSSGLGWLPWGGAATQDLARDGDILNVLARFATFGLTNQKIAGKEMLLMIDGLKHLILPTFVLSLMLIARWTRHMRSSMLEVQNQDYVRAARAKGVSSRRVLYRHALRNALIPLITVVALDLPWIFGMIFIVENVFNWPGLGRLFVDAIKNTDWPVLHGILIVNAFLIIFLNLAADLIYPVVDPRITYS